MRKWPPMIIAAGIFRGVAFGLLRTANYLQPCLGSKSPDRDDPMLSDTLFRIASVSKMMTAAGLMREVDAGTVALNRLVTEFAPGFATADGKPYASQLTLTHCLTMSTGLYDLIYIGWPGTCPQSLVTFFDGGEYTLNPASLFRHLPKNVQLFQPQLHAGRSRAGESERHSLRAILGKPYLHAPGHDAHLLRPSKAQTDGNVAGARCSINYCWDLYPGDPSKRPRIGIRKSRWIVTTAVGDGPRPSGFPASRTWPNLRPS